MIHKRLAADPYGFTGHYQRVKEYVRHRRPEILAELDADNSTDGHRGFHATFSTTAGAQAQVDWGEEGTITWTLSGDAHQLITHDRARGEGVVGRQRRALGWAARPHPAARQRHHSDADAASYADDEAVRPWTQVEVAHRPLRDYDLVCHERAGGSGV